MYLSTKYSCPALTVLQLLLQQNYQISSMSLRSLYCITCSDDDAVEPTASPLLRQRRLRWLGYLHRMASSLPVGKVYDFNPIIHGSKRDGLIPSSTTSMLLASTSPMLPRWSLTDPSGRPLLADCQRSNPSKALKWSEVCSAIHVLRHSINSHTCVDALSASIIDYVTLMSF